MHVFSVYKGCQHFVAVEAVSFLTWESFRILGFVGNNNLNLKRKKK